MRRVRVLLVTMGLALAAMVHAQEAKQAQARTYAYAFENEGGDDEAGIARLDSFIQQRLRDAGLLASGRGDGTVEVTLTHYYMRSDGARAWAGVMAGRDKVTSRVRVLDRNGAVLDEFEVGNSNATVFGSAAGLHEKHADEIVEKLRQVE